MKPVVPENVFNRAVMKIAFAVAALVLLPALLSLYWVFVAPFSAAVLSSSMEPTLYGPRWEPICPHCGNLFTVSVNDPTPEKIASARLASCPACGFSEIPLDAKRLLKGDRVVVSRRTAPPPRRWDVVARRSAGGLTVKRVAGLPGEEVELRRGTLYVNGEPVSKPRGPWSQVLLNTVRKAEPGRLLVLNRLPYPLLEGEGERAQSYPLPVTNAPASLPLDEPKAPEFVNDYSVEFPARFLKEVSLILNQGDRAWHIALSPDGKLVLRRISLPEECSPEEGTALAESDFEGAEEQTAEFPAESGNLTVSCADARLSFFSDGTLLFSFPNPPLAETSRPVTCPLIILTDSPEAYIPARFLVKRDVGYGTMHSRRLGADEYFLLGDNPAASVDSRAGDDPVRADQLRTVTSPELAF